MISAIWRRVQLLFAQGRPTLIDEAKVQARILKGEVLPNIDRIEPYGFSYRPHPGGEAFIVFPGGDRSHGIAVLIGDKQYNMELAEGEVALHDDEGNYVHLSRGGKIKIKSASSMEIDTQAMRIEAAQSVTINTQALSIKADTVEVNASSQVAIHAPLILLDAPITQTTGAANVGQTLTVAQGLAVMGGGGASSIQGNFKVEGKIDIEGGITANGKDIGERHTHSGVLSGTANTGPVV